MKVRTFTARPPGNNDPIRDLVQFGRTIAVETAPVADTLIVSITPPKNGWMRLSLSSSGLATEWYLTNIPDPFAVNTYGSENGYFLEIIDWLEALAAGACPALGFDMEGLVGVLLVSATAEPDIICLFVLTDPHRVELAAQILRHRLVESIYGALMEFWEGEDLRTSWSHWSDRPRWSLRSKVVEDYLAASSA